MLANPRDMEWIGDALVLATCWALLALRGRKEPHGRKRAEKRGRGLSLAWLFCKKILAKIEERQLFTEDVGANGRGK